MIARVLLVGALATAIGVAFALAQGPRVVRITAHKFAFDPPQVTLKRGETVVLELVSVDRQHGFKVPALGIREDAMPGEVRRVTLTPDKAGNFAFLCDVFCGDGHDEMEGQIVVTE